MERNVIKTTDAPSLAGVRGVRAIMALSLFLAAAGASSSVEAQTSLPASVSNPGSAAKAAALDAFLAKLNAVYVFPEVAKAVTARFAKERKRLLAIEDPELFAKAVNDAVRETAKDVHLVFLYDPERHAGLLAPPAPDAPEPAKPPMLHDNHGFKQVAVLDGNIGLLEIDLMSSPTREAGARAVAAMAFLADADAIVIDLRGNPGGDGRMNQLLSTYFFSEDEEKMLVTNENRSRGTLVQEWTMPFAPGKRMPNTPLYFLVGKGTGSAAEGFAFSLQALGRAKVVGEPTAGAAHSGDLFAFGGGFVAFVPSGRVLSPATKTNWEGKGVTPDFPVSSALAMPKALEAIWRERLRKAGAASPEGEWSAWQASYYEAKAAPVPLPQNAADYVGTYGEDRRVFLFDGALHYQRGTGTSVRLTPLKDGTFVAEALDAYGPGTNRIRFVRGANGAVTGYQQLVRRQPFAVATFDYGRQ
jgi:hypothetical protein